MSTNLIYCYSGTGNCLDMAKNIAKELGDTDIVMMRSFPAVTETKGAKRVGFVFPCFGGGAPTDVLEYAKFIHITPETYVFAVSQSASYAGTGLAELNKIHPLDYWRTVTHQCSCIWLFPHTLMMPPMTPKQAQKRSEKLAKEIGREILSMAKTEKNPPRNVLNAAENAGERRLHRLRSVCEAVSQREHPPGKRPGRHREQLCTVPGLPAVLPHGRDFSWQRHGQAGTLSQPECQSRRSDGEGYPHRLSMHDVYLAHCTDGRL